MAEPIYRGNPRRPANRREERPVPGRSDQMGPASQRRAYDYQQQRAIEANDWSEQRYFEERPDRRRGGKPTNRSQEWKNRDKDKRKNNAQQRPAQTATEDPKPIPDFKAKKETPEAEPNFDVGYYQASIPVKERYSQNHDHGGFISLIDGVYEELLGLDKRVSSESRW